MTSPVILLFFLMLFSWTPVSSALCQVPGITSKNPGILVLIVFLFFGCESIESENPVIASMGNEQLTLNDALEAVPQELLQQDSLFTVTRYRDQWLQSKVNTAHASGLHLDQTELFQMRISRIKEQLLQDMLSDAILSENASELEVSDQEARQYFQAHREQFLMNERFVRFRHITTNTRAEAEEANRDIMSGVEWNEIADNYSIHPEQQKQFAEKFWPESMVLQEHPELRYFLSYIGLTERSPIAYSNGHYHMIQLMEEKKEEEYPDLEWLLPRIKEWIKVEKSQRIVNAYLRNLYLQAEANNEIYSVPVTELDELLKYHQLPD